MNAEIIKTLKEVRDSLDALINTVEASESTAKADNAASTATAGNGKTINLPTQSQKPQSGAKSLSRKDREAAETLPSSDFTREDLDSLSYNNLKKFAKEMGLSAVGSREELTDKIMETKNTPATSEKSEPVTEEVKPAPAPAPSGKIRKLKKSEPEPVEEEEEEVDPVELKVNEAVEGMSDEEIMDFLADVGVKAKGKRQALISAVVKAVREGKIELEDDESSDSEESVDEVESSESADDSETELGINDPDNPDMTEERREALAQYESDSRESFENGDFTRESLIEWLNDFNGTQEDMSDMTDEELFEEYLNYSSLLISDEGVMPEEGAYTVNGIPYCCGHELQYDEKKGTFTCSFCGTEYDAE